MIPEKIKWYENGNWDSPEMLSRVLDAETCKALVSRRIYLYNQQLWETELSSLWVQEEANKATASYGAPWGFYTSLASVARYYDAQRHCLGSGEGLSLFRTVNTPVVFISGDGKTAQGMWLMAGEETGVDARGKVQALHIYGRVAVDFVREEAGWRIWHWTDVYNMTQRVGEDIAGTTVQELPEERLLKPIFMAGEPDIVMQTHYPEYHGTDGWPKYPCAHETYGPDNSCGPDGHPALMPRLEDVNWALRMAQLKAWGRTVKNG